MKKITVVVPIYNVARYLPTCFESLMRQSFKDFEVMAVNDGSSDESWDIMQEYSKKYPDMIKIVNKPNGGYGSVLQLAIARMDTPYFLVCDPDDYLADDALEHLYKLASVSDCDIVIGAKNFIYNESDKVDYDRAYNSAFVTLDVNKVYHRNNENYEDLLFVDPSPHSKLYRRVLADKIQFPEKVGYTDNLLFYVSLLNAKKVLYTDKACAYYLIDRPGNSMQDVSFKAQNGHILVFKEILKQTKTLNPGNIFYYRMFESYKFIFRQMSRVATDKEGIIQLFNNLYGIIDMLMPYKKMLMVGYRKYSKAKIVERMKDRLLLDKAFSEKVYRDITKEIIAKFE